MSKSEYIRAFLDKIKGYREPATGLIVVLNHGKLSDNQISQMYALCSGIVDDIQKDSQHADLQLMLDHIAKIKTKEQKSESVLSDKDLNTILSNI